MGLPVNTSRPGPKEVSRVFDIVAKPWYYNFCIHYVMILGPKRLFPIHLHGERDVCNSVNNTF